VNDNFQDSITTVITIYNKLLIIINSINTLTDRFQGYCLIN